jgi:hypothetical protein
MTQPPNLEPQMPPEPPQMPDQNQATQAPGAKPTGPGFEFTLMQDEVIRMLSKKMN